MNGSTNAEVMTTDTASALNGKQDAITYHKYIHPEITVNFTDFTWGNMYADRWGNVVTVNVYQMYTTNANNGVFTIASGLPKPATQYDSSFSFLCDVTGVNTAGTIFITSTGVLKWNKPAATGTFYGSITYITGDP